MAMLEISIDSAECFRDISPEPGCCGTRVPSSVMGYFVLDGNSGVWNTSATPLPDHQGGKITWNAQFKNIKITDPEGARLEFFFVDAAYWQPEIRPGPDQAKNNRNPPPQHFYGTYAMSVIQFERGKTETQTLTLKDKQGMNTMYSFTVTGRFQESNIDDARLESRGEQEGKGGPGPQPQTMAAAPAPVPGVVPQPAPAAQPAPVAQPAPYAQPVAQPAPVAQPVAYAPPVAQPAPVAQPVAYAQPWPPAGPPAGIPLLAVPQTMGNPCDVGSHPPGQTYWNGLNIGNGGNTDTGSDVGSKMGDVVVIANSKIHWASLWGKLILYNCLVTACDPEHGAEIYVFGGSFDEGDNKGGQVWRM